MFYYWTTVSLLKLQAYHSVHLCSSTHLHKGVCLWVLIHTSVVLFWEIHISGCTHRDVYFCSIEIWVDGPFLKIYIDDSAHTIIICYWFFIEIDVYDSTLYIAKYFRWDIGLIFFINISTKHVMSNLRCLLMLLSEKRLL